MLFPHKLLLNAVRKISGNTDFFSCFLHIFSKTFFQGIDTIHLPACSDKTARITITTERDQSCSSANRLYHLLRSFASLRMTIKGGIILLLWVNILLNQPLYASSCLECLQTADFCADRCQPKIIMKTSCL